MMNPFNIHDESVRFDELNPPKSPNQFNSIEPLLAHPGSASAPQTADGCARVAAAAAKLLCKEWLN